MSDLDYAALRAQRKPRPRRAKFSPEVNKARSTERNMRANRAAARAHSALAKAYPDDFAALYDAAKAEIYAECGPLPGDE